MSLSALGNNSTSPLTYGHIKRSSVDGPNNSKVTRSAGQSFVIGDQVRVRSSIPSVMRNTHTKMLPQAVHEEIVGDMKPFQFPETSHPIKSLACQKNLTIL